MNPDDLSQSRTARRLVLAIDAERLTMSTPRFGLSLMLGVLTFVLLCAYWIFAPSPAPKAQAPTRYEELPGGGRITLTPLVEFESPESARKRELMSYVRGLQPVLPVALGFLAFFVSYRTLRARIILDRRVNRIQYGRRTICALNDIVSVELDDAPRIYVMNTLALVLPRDRRLTLLYYDKSTDSALRRKAEAIAAFAGVPLKAGMRSAQRARKK